MKSKILDRPMFKKKGKSIDPENVGIMQGFSEMLDEDELKSFMGEEEDGEEKDYDSSQMMERTPRSPEILMNNLRGDMKSIDARVEELADLVGYNAAASTPTEVLALLQPVLAAEAQQGIGALPAAGMDQPPQGMPPPLPGGMPPGSPPLPPAAAPNMSPPTDMPVVPNTSAAGMPAGGIETLNMAKGGYVQHFQAGSGEEGVTPLGDTSLVGSYPPEMIQEAREKVMNFLTKQPLQTPDLAARTAERTPLYEKLLGYDRNVGQAQALLDISKAALNFAGNVDEQGQPLRGSFASRAARAFAPLPAKLSERIGEKAKLEQGIRLAAMQATEKEIADIREQNLRLLEQQRQGWSKIAGGSTSGAFGSGKEGKILDYFVRYAPGYGKGTLTDAQTRTFEAAVKDYTQPTFEQYLDPVDQKVRIRERRAELPDFVRTALDARKLLNAPPQAPSGKKGKKDTAPSVPPPVTTTIAPTDTGTAPAPAPAAEPATVAEAPTTDQAPATPNFNYTRKDPLTVRPGIQSYFTNERPTMFGASFQGTGIPSAVSSLLYRTPGIGPAIGSKEMAEARDYLENSVNRINSALANSPRFAETERQQIQKQLNLLPGIFDNPTAYRSRLFALDDYLILLQNQAIEDSFNKKLPSDLNRAARERASILHNVRENIGSPLRIYDYEDPRLKLVPPGTPFLWNGEQWQVTRPLQRNK